MLTVIIHMLTKSANPVNRRIGALLRIPWQWIRARIHSEIAAAGFADVRPRDLAILQYPGPDGQRPTQLAARAEISKQAAKPLIDHLVECGYLTRSADPSDQRAQLVHTTARGRRLLAAIQTAIGTVEEDLRRELGARPYAELVSGLERLSEAANRLQDHTSSRQSALKRFSV
jgi:DNA-binding MarR family transcriptional regulator